MNKEEADELETFILERNQAFETLDLAWARKALGYSRADDEMLLMSLHKARYECRHISPELRHESRRWLQERGCRRLSQQPWLGEEELP